MLRFSLAAPDNWLERWFVLLGALPEVRWVETGHLAKKQLPVLARRLRETGVSWGFHFPLLKTASWPALVEQGHSPGKRRLLRRMMSEHCRRGAAMGASYVDIHLPFYMRGVPDAQFLDILAEEAEYWADLARRTGLAVHLENARLRPGIFESAADFVDLCRRYDFRICFDAGHLFGQVVEGRFQPELTGEFVRKIAPYTAAVHVYQFRAADIIMHEGRAEVMRCPAMPRLDPREGWADLPALLAPIVRANPDCLLVLEHGYGQGVGEIRAEIEWLERELTGKEVVGL